MLLIEKINLESCNNLEIILFNNNSNKELFNFIVKSNNELNQLFKSITNYFNYI